MIDHETISVYDARADEYAGMMDQVKEMSGLSDFCARLPQGACVLDLGCGPGHASAEMAGRGFDVTAWDASAEMIARTAQLPGVVAAQKLFSDLPTLEAHSLDGIWANFSLLHAPRAEMSDHLAAIAKALKPGGVFFIALKEGEGTHRDAIGRLYTYYTEAELKGLLEAAGFHVVAQDAGSGRGLSGEESHWISLTCLR